MTLATFYFLDFNSIKWIILRYFSLIFPLHQDYGSNPMNPIDRYNYMPGGTYNPSGGNYGNNYGNSIGSYGNRNPYEGGSINGPYQGPGVGMGMGMFPQDLEGKTSLILPLAGAALLGKFLNKFLGINQ